MGKLKLVCFDLDDTLIREIHSVMLPCILNGKEKEHSIIQKQEESGVIDYISADYLRAKLLIGLEESKIAQSFLEIAKALKNIKSVVKALHEQNIKYEVVDGKFTGRILNYIEAEHKISCLQDFCKYNSIEPEECVAVGDGATDIPIFGYCGKSIAINSSQMVRKSAMYAVDTDDLTDILKYILGKTEITYKFDLDLDRVMMEELSLLLFKSSSKLPFVHFTDFQNRSDGTAPLHRSTHKRGK